MSVSLLAPRCTFLFFWVLKPAGVSFGGGSVLGSVSRGRCREPLSCREREASFASQQRDAEGLGLVVSVETGLRELRPATPRGQLLLSCQSDLLFEDQPASYVLRGISLLPYKR